MKIYEIWKVHDNDYNDDKVDWKIAKTITKFWFTQQDVWTYIALVTCMYDGEAGR